MSRPRKNFLLRDRKGVVRFQPRIEALEDRMAPAVINWINPGGGAWEMASNWSTGGLPGPADDVVINTLDPGATITHASDNTSLRSLTTALSNPATLAINGGTLLVAGSAALDALMTLSLNTGTIGGSADWTVNGPLNWAGGTISGDGTLTANGGMSLSGTSKTLDRCTLTIPQAATASWTTGTGNLALQNGASLYNEGLIDMRIDRSVTTSGILTVFVNDGTIRLSNTTGTATFALPVYNHGTIDVQSGTMVIAGSGLSNGQFLVAAPATLALTGNIVFNFLAPTSMVSGSGNVVFAGGLIDVGGSYDISGSSSFTGVGSSNGVSVTFLGALTNIGSSLSVGPSNATVNFGANTVTTQTATISGGTLMSSNLVVVTSQMLWTGGTLAGAGDDVLARYLAVGDGTNPATLTITGSAGKTLDDRILALRGTTNWTGTGNLSLSNGSVIFNDGTFNVQVDNSLATNGTLAAFYNFGTFQQLNSTGITTLATPFFNSGTVDVQTGTLVLASGSQDSTYASYQVEALPGTPAATLTFSGGTHRVIGSITGAGNVVFAGGLIEIGSTYNIAGSGTYNVTGSTSVTGTVSGGVNVIFLESHLLSLGSSFALSSIYGAVVNLGTNDITISTVTVSGGTLLGVGTVMVSSRMSWTGGTLGDQGELLIDQATLNISGSSSKFLDARTLVISFNATANWTGAGSINLSNSAGIRNTGTFNNQTNSAISLSGALSDFVNSGVFRQLNTTNTTTLTVPFFNAGTLDVQVGTLVFADGGFNTGSITVAAPATLIFGGGDFEVYPGANSTVSGAGAVIFAGGYTEVGGSFNITGSTAVTAGMAAANVLFSGNILSLGSSFTLSPFFGATVNLGLNTVTVTTATISGGLLLGGREMDVTGQMNWSGGTLAEDLHIEVGANLNITGSVTLDNALVLNGGAAAIWTGTGATLTFADSADLFIVLTATFSVENNQSTFTGSGYIENEGLFRKAFSTGSTAVNVPLYNYSGQVQIQTGILSLLAGGTSFDSSGFMMSVATAGLTFGGGTYATSSNTMVAGPGTVTFSGGTTDIRGSYTVTGPTNVTGNAVVNFLHDASSGALVNQGGLVGVGAGSTLTVAGNYTQSSGTTALNGGTLVAANVLINGGLLSGLGTINSNVTNAGALSVGAPPSSGSFTGILTITGTYTQTSNGTLTIKIGGSTAGTQFDQLVINGLATLGGTLNVTLINGFAPVSGSTFAVVQYLGGRNNTQFATVNLPSRFVHTPVYDDTNDTLTLQMM